MPAPLCRGRSSRQACLCVPIRSARSARANRRPAAGASELQGMPSRRTLDCRRHRELWPGAPAAAVSRRSPFPRASISFIFSSPLKCANVSVGPRRALAHQLTSSWACGCPSQARFRRSSRACQNGQAVELALAGEKSECPRFVPAGWPGRAKFTLCLGQDNESCCWSSSSSSCRRWPDIGLSFGALAGWRRHQ